MESEGGKMESDPPSPVRALFQPEYRSRCDPPCLSFSALSRQALINISTLLCQPQGVERNRWEAEARAHKRTHPRTHAVWRCALPVLTPSRLLARGISKMWSFIRTASQAARRAPLFNPSAAACESCQTTRRNTGKGCCSLLNREGGTDRGRGEEGGGRNKEWWKILRPCFSKFTLLFSQKLLRCGEIK